MAFLVPCAPNPISSCQMFCAWGKNFRYEGFCCVTMGCCSAYTALLTFRYNFTIAKCQNTLCTRYCMCFAMWGGKPGIQQAGAGQEMPGNMGYYVGVISTCGCQYYLSIAAQCCQPQGGWWGLFPSRWSCNYYCMPGTFNQCDGALNSLCAYCMNSAGYVNCQPAAEFAWCWQIYCSPCYLQDMRFGTNNWYIPSRCELLVMYRLMPIVNRIAPNEGFICCKVAQTFFAYRSSTAAAGAPNNGMENLFFGDGFFCQCDRTQFICTRLVMRIPT